MHTPRNPARLAVFVVGLSIFLLALVVSETGPANNLPAASGLARWGMIGGALITVAGYVVYHGGLSATFENVARLARRALSRVRRPRAGDLAMLLVSVVLTLAVTEGIIRLTGETDADGQFTFLSTPVRPYALPVASTADNIDAYLASSTSYLVYDPYLGWTLRPDAESLDGLYRTNSAGLRADGEYDPSAAPGVVRVALFGDSFTHGTDVPFEDSWGQRVEGSLQARGPDVEVLNFGVGGYGMDQAFLRWQRLGRSYAPDIVLLGFQPENASRNVNLFRPFYFRDSAIPFTKPRYILNGQRLELVNSPTIPPDEIVQTIAHFPESPLAEYESFFDPADYADHWWLKSRFVGLVSGALGSKRTGPADLSVPDGEAARVSKAIIEAFAADVEAQGGQFVIVVLPGLSDLRRVRAGRALPYADFLAYLDAHYEVIHTERDFTDRRLPDYFEPSLHYSVEGNRVVAGAVADQLEELAGE